MTIHLPDAVATMLTEQAQASGTSLDEQMVADRIAVLLAEGHTEAAVDLASRHIAAQHHEVNAALAALG